MRNTTSIPLKLRDWRAMERATWMWNSKEKKFLQRLIHSIRTQKRTDIRSMWSTNAELDLSLYESQSTGNLCSTSVAMTTVDNAEHEAREWKRGIANAIRIASYIHGFYWMYSLTVLTYWVERFKRTDVCTSFVKFSCDTIPFEWNICNQSISGVT